jgi:hypothetical protein
MLSKRKALRSAAVALSAGLVVVVLLLWSADRGRNEFLAAAALNQSVVRLEGVSCLAIDRHQVVFDQQAYSDPDLVQEISNILKVKTVVFGADYATCPWSFSVVVVPGQVHAVRFNGQPATRLISIDICERTSAGRVNPNRCLSKNIYVFKSRAEPHDLFSIALVGLARPQANEWEMFNGKAPE